MSTEFSASEGDRYALALTAEACDLRCERNCNVHRRSMNGGRRHTQIYEQHSREFPMLEDVMA